MYDLSICVPTIRKNLLPYFVETALSSCINYSLEFVFVGPYPLPEILQNHTNIRHIQDYGSPSRACQIAAYHAQGKLMTWCSDDGWFLDDSLDQAINLWNIQNNPKSLMCMRYYEGVNHSGKPNPLNYWTAHTHDALRYNGVKPEWLIAPHGMMLTSYFKEMGGLDCSFIHMNMNLHDLAFRIYKDGGSVVLSPTNVMNLDWNWAKGDNIPISEIWPHDRDLFVEIYKEYNPDRVKIDFENWRLAESVWNKRFSNKGNREFGEIK